MDLSSLGLFQRMEQKMHWLSARQTVLSENVANADTPGYRARDLKPFTLGQTGSAVSLAQTQAGHIQSATGSAYSASALAASEVTETSPDGNQVSLEDQLTKVADTGMEYQMLTNLYRKQISMIKTAIGRNGTSA